MNTQVAIISKQVDFEGMNRAKNEQTDRELIVNTINGHRNAFGGIVTKYRHKALGIAVSLVGDIEIARDLTQDAFIKAYRSLGTYDIDAAFLPWFYRILKNVCLDHLRRKKRLRNILEKIKTVPSEIPNAMNDVQKMELSQKIRNAVKKLPPKEKEIIELKHFAGFSYQEISEILNIRKGTVMSRLFYARKALRNLLSHTLDFEGKDDQ